MKYTDRRELNIIYLDNFLQLFRSKSLCENGLKYRIIGLTVRGENILPLVEMLKPIFISQGPDQCYTRFPPFLFVPFKTTATILFTKRSFHLVLLNVTLEDKSHSFNRSIILFSF